MEELITRVAVKVDRRQVKFAMVKGNKQKKSSKGREASPAWDTTTARAGDVDEPSTSQDPPDQLPLGAVGGGDEEISYQKLAKPFTDAQDRQIAVFFGQHPCFYDKTDQDYKNKKRREALIKQFAQTMFASGKCVCFFFCIQLESTPGSIFDGDEKSRNKKEKLQVRSRNYEVCCIVVL